MGNIKQQFDALFAAQSLAVATVTGQRGGSVSARTEAGAAIILEGEAEIGKKVRYDRHTGRIVGIAPNLPLTDIALP